MARPERVYVTIAAVGAFVSTLAFTITPFYRFQVAGLDNFELVLAGTLMEAAVFCFEIPTGVVADQWSRKWSVIVGHLGMGVGLLIEASVPSVAGVLGGQIVWGIAYTFTSGATVAWLTAELDEPDRVALTALFLRASRFGSGAALVAVPLAFLLGGWSLRLPIVIAGAHLRAARRVADERDERAPLRAGVGPRHVARARPHGRRGRAGDPEQPGPRHDRRRHLPRRRGERGVRPLQREVPARRHRPARMARVVGADVDGGDRLHVGGAGRGRAVVVPTSPRATSTSRRSGGGSSGSWSSRSPVC